LDGHFWEKYHSIIIGTGEVNKTLATVTTIYNQLLDLGVDRSGFILGIGGGIVCDIAGYVAATYLRGLRCAFVPTTLLAQVDAAIGGKNGVNFHGYKNLIGTFRQPEFVLNDPGVLQSLPPEERANGFAEIVKHALIADDALFTFIEDNTEKMLNLDLAVINRLIMRSVEIKAGIVNRDEQEKGERRKLNFGHTFGHAIEKVSGLSHGKAVAIGSVIAARMSMERGYLKSYDYERIRNVLTKLNLPTEITGDKVAVLAALFNDKKREQDFIYFVLLDNIGQAVIEKIPVGDLKNLTF
jgi:3-dehydroquinate synthase